MSGRLVRMENRCCHIVIMWQHVRGSLKMTRKGYR